MGILRLDATTNAGFVGRDLGTPVSEVWAQVDVAFDSTYLTNLVAQSFAFPVLQGQASTLSAEQSLDIWQQSGTVKWSWDFGTPISYTPASAVTALQFYTVEMHLTAGSPMACEFWVDGVSVGALTITADLADIQYLALYGEGGFSGYVYFDNFKAGTTRHGTDLYADDFEGDLSGWNDATPTDATIVTDPGISPPAPPPASAVPEGVSFAFTDGPLDDPVTWTRLDNQAGLHITEITIDRGRGDERSKTNPGMVTIKGYDSAGVLDPTNTGSPFYPDVKPVKQAAVSVYNPVTKDWHYRFRGYADTFAYTLDPSEKFMEFEITLVDMLDMLNDAEIAPDQAGNTVPSESAGDCYYTGQHCDDRLLAVLADASVDFPSGVFQATWPATLLQIASGNVFVQGRVYSRGTSLLQVIDEACDAEFPGSTNRFITKDGAFAFRGRYYRFVPAFYAASSDANRASGHELVHWDVGDIPAYKSDSTLAAYTGLKFQLGKTNLVNAALVTPIGVTDAQLASGSNFYSDGTSVGNYGPRTSGMSLENLITGTADDGNTAMQETASFAEATVHNYKDPVTFVSELTFRNPAGGDSTLEQNVWAFLCGVELSDLVTVTSTHPGGGGFSAEDHYVESLKETWAPLQGDTWNATVTVGLSSKKHFTYTPSSWNVPAVS